MPTETIDIDIRAAKGSGGGTKAAGLVVGAANPSAAKRSTTVDVRILGSGFDRNMYAKWAIDSVATSHVKVNSTRFVSSTELVANITVSDDAPLTEYDIIITSTKGGKPGIGTEIFEVVQELDLGSLGGAFSGAYALNESGQIAGYSSYYATSGGSSHDRPVIWTGGTIRDLLPSGYTMGRATDVNESGTVVGWAVRSSDFYIVPFIWNASTGFRVLPTIAGENNTGALAINDAGIVAGYSGRAAVIWESGALRVIQSVANRFTTAVDVNSSGVVIAVETVTQTGGSPRSLKWSAASGVQFLETLNGNAGSVTAINDLGTIIGNGPTPTDSTGHPFIIEGGVTRELVSGFGRISLTSLSEAGHIVGQASGGRGFLRDPSGLETIICTPVAPAPGAGYSTSCGAWAVGDNGNSVGWKTDKYGQATKAYKWELMPL